MTVELCLHFGSARNWTMDLLGDQLSAKNHVGSMNRDLALATMDVSVAMHTYIVQESAATGIVKDPTTAAWIKV